MQKQEAREAKLYMEERKLQAMEGQNRIEQENVRVKKNEFELKRQKQMKKLKI